MKKNLFVVVLLTAFVFNSCQEKVAPVKDYFVISGNIKNFRKRNIELVGHNYKRKIKFNRKAKTFSDTIRNIVPGHYELKVGKRPINLYLTDTVDTKLSVDAKKRTKAPSFTGGNANVNNYLSNRRKKFGLVYGNARKLFSLEESDFLAKVDEYKKELSTLANKSNLPADYLAKELRNIGYECDRNIINYQPYHRMVTGDDEYVISSDFPTESGIINNINFNKSDDYLNSLAFRKILTEHLDKLSDERLPEKGDKAITHLETIHSEISDTLVKNDLLHQIADESITYTSDLPNFYKKYMSFSTSEKNKKEITDIYNKLKFTAKGQPSPKFVGYESYKDGSKISLDDLTGKGKYIYIDIWATWCSFCKKEIPLLKNFENKYHGKNIEFVSINVDKKANYKKWKKTIKEREMGGVQLFAGDTEANLQFTKDYLIKGLPRFILIDPDGKIVSANAPRPSDGEKLDNIFKELGIEAH